MMHLKHNWTDEQIEQIVGNLLRIGVMAAAVVVLVGGILYLIHSGTTMPNYRVFHGEPSDLRSLSGIAGDAFSRRPQGLIQFGLLLLIATPVARVALSVFAFALQRDRTYVLVTLIVLALLMYSLTGGRL
ncbi:MAG: DUF1634 domain-containing protein [Acidobacteriota bacterium]|nr:DUF1634 domain-containing protein [Blastocatellia bacterium]MDW8241502.1 DUF1634 domain-containing protein [Acidobacteriota bacterium]